MKLTVLNTAKTILVWGLVSTCHSQTFLQGIDLNSRVEQTRIIAITLLAEARGEGESGLRRCGKVFLCRARKRGIPVYQECIRHATSSFWLTAPSRATCLKLLSNPMADLAMYLAGDLMDDKDVFPNWEATNFFSGSPPKWAYSPRMRFVEKFKHHTFYKEI